jgi:hypothetical protein
MFSLLKKLSGKRPKTNPNDEKTNKSRTVLLRMVSIFFCFSKVTYVVCGIRIIRFIKYKITDNYFKYFKYFKRKEVSELI